MSRPDDRIEELIAAVVAGNATPAEVDELDRLRPAHPWIDDELAAMRAIDERLREADVTWTTPGDAGALRARILSEIPSASPRERPDARAELGRRRRRWTTPLLAAACLVVGVVIGIAAPTFTSMPPSGPPGTLGAVESIDLRDEVVGVRLDAELVAHTWGTEAVLDATGLDVGATYSVVFIAADGTEFSAGQILGSEVPIHCRVNAAVMRADAVRLEIRDADAGLVAVANLVGT
ncbi:hypothetical protein [Microbacterium sp. P05]|uniref:hypothetical protein n=1 Tax=Microbacterium sp. P05 TaxID=3366948 RepID=UPI00374590D8